MKLLLTVTPLVALLSVASAVHVRYDNTYDEHKGSLSTVACSTGANGLVTKGFHTFGSLPSFPNLCAAQAARWNSTACGSCWQITHGEESVNVTAVDHAGDGFNLSLEAMKKLTGGDDAEVPGVIDAHATEIDRKYCGL